MSNIVTIEEIEDLPNRPDTLLIDVRDPPELKATGIIPTSINIPCKSTTTKIQYNKIIAIKTKCYLCEFFVC